MDAPLTSSSPRWWRVWLLAAVLFAVLLVQNAGILNAGFGVSHDGTNAAVWGTGSRAMREVGLVESRFGGVAPGQTYANHPPGILAETFVAESLLGEHRWVTRLPAILSSAVALVLLVGLLRELGFGPAPTAFGATVFATSDMFLSFGTMLDTPVTSLPFSLAAVWLVARAHRERSVPVAAAAAVGFGSAVSGWQSTVFVGVAGAALLALGRRNRPARTTGIAAIGGATAGLLIDVLWVRWVYGSLGSFLDQARGRSSGVTVADSINQQVSNLVDLVPIAAVVGGVGLVLMVRARRDRLVVAVAVVPTVLYALIFREGAFQHHYWNYSLMIGLAIGAAALAHQLVERRHDLGRAVVVAIALLVGVSFVLPSAARDSRDAQLDGAQLVQAAVADHPDGAPRIVLVEGADLLGPIRYEAGAEPLSVPTVDDLPAVATRIPDGYLVTSERRWPADAWTRLRADATSAAGPLILVRLDRVGQIVDDSDAVDP